MDYQSDRRHVVDSCIKYDVLGFIGLKKEEWKTECAEQVNVNEFLTFYSSNICTLNS